MSSPYVGEIRMFAGNFAPVGWALCQGQLMAISENETLFNLIGTTYGGDGQNTFALPNLQGRVPIHAGTGSAGTAYTQGEVAGVESVILTANQMPSHTHAAIGDGTGGGENSPQGHVWGTSTAAKQYLATVPATPPQMNAAALSNAGGSQPHDNMLPFLAINFIISLFGIYPSQT